MSGFCDSTTGLAFGIGLQFQAQIGTAGLIITSIPATAMFTEGGIEMITESGIEMVTE